MLSMPDFASTERSAGTAPGPAGAARAALRSLSSATLTVGSAAAFLALVTLLSFVPEGGAGDRTIAWQLRGSLPSSDVPAPPRERMAQRAAS